MSSIQALIDRQLTRRQVLEKAQKARPPVVHPVAPPPLTVITVSRETGSGGRTLARNLATRLQYEFIDHQIVDKLVEDSGARQRLIDSLDERTRSGVILWVEGILTGRYIDRTEYAQLLIKSVTALAEHGHSVMLGRGANVILGPRGGFHVRITAPPEVRVQSLMREMGLSPREARQMVESSDEERLRFYADVLKADVDNPNDYHLLINTGRVDLETAESLILMGWDRHLKKQETIRAVE
jgi:cytidylate kinase